MRIDEFLRGLGQAEELAAAPTLEERAMILLGRLFAEAPTMGALHTVVGSRLLDTTVGAFETLEERGRHTGGVMLDLLTRLQRLDRVETDGDDWL